MLHRTRNSRPGIAATEMALLAPVVLTLLMGLWEVGRYVSMQNVLDSAAREGGRLGASGAFFSSNNMNAATAPNAAFTLPTPSTNTACELQKKVVLFLQNAGLSTTGVTVTVKNSGSSTSPKSWTYTYSQNGTITGSGYDPTASASQLDTLTATVSMPYSNIAWSPLSWFVSQGATMNAKASWGSMNDVPLTVSTAIPTKPIQPTDPLP